ncbi:GDP-L-fucose synthase [Rhabdaerophilum sp. SD176]|uniref:GDP-L-fucose synthase n=1 Tax=Rhabdaerophilum sp. SD176 TaxID=2983548 RepID=UPI0024E0336A|nr:GDP-L-fucose synthase [Rhabdaerophilum sp. SD176]
MSASFDLKDRRIFVAGHRGMVGSAIVRALRERGIEPLTADRDVLDLERQAEVEAWLAANRPEVIILAAAKVGGIHANNSFPRDFLYRNMMIAANVIDAAYRNGVNKLLYLGSSCIYPREAPQPIPETALLTGTLEPTNEWYAIAKIAGMKLTQAYRRQCGADYISLMPTNLYGKGDNYHPENSHVIAALLRRFHEAKAGNAPAVTIWGTGTPRREFLYVDDFAEAALFALERHSSEDFMNVGTGQDLTIADLAREIAGVVGFTGELVFDTSRPDGTPRKLLDVSRIKALGWQARTPLREGLRIAYADFLAGGGRNH